MGMSRVHGSNCQLEVLWRTCCCQWQHGNALNHSCAACDSQAIGLKLGQAGRWLGRAMAWAAAARRAHCCQQCSMLELNWLSRVMRGGLVRLSNSTQARASLRSNAMCCVVPDR